MIKVTFKEIEKWIDEIEKEMPEPTNQAVVMWKIGRLNGIYDLFAFLRTKEVKDESD